jgi:hypothetical protein
MRSLEQLIVVKFVCAIFVSSNDIHIPKAQTNRSRFWDVMIHVKHYGHSNQSLVLQAFYKG